MPNLSNNNNHASLLVMLLKDLAAAVLGVLAVFGLALSGEQIGAILTLVGTIGTALTFLVWATTVQKKKVVERLIGKSEVVAGPANDLVPEGTHVRDLEETP